MARPNNRRPLQRAGQAGRVIHTIFCGQSNFSSISLKGSPSPIGAGHEGFGAWQQLGNWAGRGYRDGVLVGN